jgi:adenosylcobyric acid synthase
MAAAARRLMIQGTGSHVGKSVLVAALCRLFVRKGLRVAPFKAQNMSNNSFVTPDGKEIARAQAVQAAACRLAPRTDFNPILIKPAGDREAQLVVGGVVAGSLQASDFGRIRREFEPVVREAFLRLAAEFDLILLEGAGSPAEVNLREHDLVNMRMATLANAPVILIGDIDRGGVLAALVGTMALLTAEERRHVKGFVINKFRGDLEVLLPGIRTVEHAVQRPCLGVVPYCRTLALPQEDALEWPTLSRVPTRVDIVTIGVVDVPCLSNFTDFEALALEPDVYLQRITHADGWSPDLLIFPGTKNTPRALRFVRERGLDRLARQVLAAGGTVLGICGGYQILGRRILDPDGVESSDRELEGLHLLNADTTFSTRKITVPVIGVHRGFGASVQGYEVHMGRTILGDAASPFLDVRQPNESSYRPDGAMSPDARVLGTYVHGLFDAPVFRRCFLNSIRERRGLPPLEPTAGPSLDDHLDQWADFVDRHLDVSRIEAIIDRPV